MNVDIYQRKCRPDCGAPRLPEPEIEITEILSGEEYLEEEEGEKEFEVEPVDINVVLFELDCMKRRIQQLQLILKTPKIGECPEEERVDFEIELNCSENKEICDLQKKQHKLQCQINELVRCQRLAKDHIEDLHKRLCEKSHRMMRMQKKIAELKCWKDTLEHEFGVCIERFEYLKHTKAEWKDVDEFLQRRNGSMRLREKSLVHFDAYLLDKMELLVQMENMKDTFQKVFDLHVRRFEHLEQLINSRTAASAPSTNKKQQKLRTSV